MTGVTTLKKKPANLVELPLRSGFDNVRLAIVSCSQRHNQLLQRVMARNNLNVVFNEPLTAVLLEKLHNREADVLLLNVDERITRCNDLAENLIRHGGEVWAQKPKVVFQYHA